MIQFAKMNAGAPFSENTPSSTALFDPHGCPLRRCVYPWVVSALAASEASVAFSSEGSSEDAAAELRITDLQVSLNHRNKKIPP